MRIGIVIPTIPGREESLRRAVDSYRRCSADVETIFSVREEAESAGAGWLEGADVLERAYGPTDYVHLTNDDIEVTSESWWRVCCEACDEGYLPAPIVRNPDESLQSAGGQLGVADDLIKEVGTDFSPVGFTTVPFLSWRQWEEIGMLPVHYSSDVWISYRGRQLGYETVLRHGYNLVHHTEQVGRIQERAAADKAYVLDVLDEHEHADEHVV